eukprot:TRINITY_DN6780_c0_g1_i1.p1 TRINITY_DN6780_c0_g1~~TRINITY_DN6780_c0_g1_i1.p1  ORF type:complete len:676 (+),score=100.15 TRINITY_DN6780_c0_g1_i1:72-2099(+)
MDKKQGEEDFVEYHLYPFPPSTPPLQDVLASYQQFLSTHSRDFIWHYDPIHLVLMSPVLAAQQKDVPHIWGRSRFGENVEDEWFIVYLLYLLSLSFHVAIRIEDTDGQFLLIEAALALPKWIRPETAENRVWIKSGILHIIPPPRNPAQLASLPTHLSVEKALFILCPPTAASITGIVTRADESIQAILNERIEGYPSKATAGIHKVRCLLPVSVAQILRAKPQFVAYAIRAFYYRDMDGMNMSSQMKKFSPDYSSKTSMCMTTVVLTRCLYAQLVYQQFHAPKAFSLPPPSHPDFKAAEIGMKITCGMEIAYQSSAKYGSHDEDFTVHAYPFEIDAAWREFKKNITGLGFFQAEIEGSQEYRRREQLAKEQFISLQNEAKQTSHDVERVLATTVDRILADESVHADAFVKLCKDELVADDDESWLFVSAEQLGTIFAQKQQELERFEKQRKEAKQTRLDYDSTASPSQMSLPNFDQLVGQMKSFVSNVSSYEGAELPHHTGVDVDVDNLPFDPDLFLNIMQSSLGFTAKSGAESLSADSGHLSDSSDDHSSADDYAHHKDEDEDKIEDAVGNIDLSQLKQVMQQMDAELLTDTTLGADFERCRPNSKETVLDPSNRASRSPTHDDNDDDDDEFPPVDVDVNLLQSMFASLSGPTDVPSPLFQILEAMQHNKNNM